MKKILIIEDEHDMAKVLERRVRSWGYDVRVAYDAYSGTSLIHKERPDLVLLDLMMPAGGGVSVLENMKLSSNVSHIPVIVLSALAEESYKKMARDLGASDYLEKPYNPVELMAAIKEILGEGV